MSDFVLDASITLSWCFADESTPKTIALLERLETATAFVPALWSLEVGNVLLAAKRRQRITQAQIIEFLALIGNLNIQIDHETAVRGFQEILSLANSDGITTYDAAYLELAMRLGLPLATKVVQLTTVAKQNGVAIC